MSAAGLVALGVAAAAGGGSVAAPGSVAITSFPATISTGQDVTIKGFVSGGGGIDVTVRLYTLPRCASGYKSLTVLTTGADGSFTFTDTLDYNPPVAYGFIVGLSQDPTRAPNFNNPDSCVTIGSGPGLNGQVQGSVTVDGTPFQGGVINYGSTVDIGAGSQVRLSADAGRFRFYPVAGEGTSFIPVRIALPKQKGKKRQFIIELQLVGGDFSKCKGAKKTQGFRTVAAEKKPPTRSLWGNGKGTYRTKGRYSSATVSGTNWLVQDGCRGTLTVVKRGVVKVTDFVKNVTVIVTTGHRYFAAAPH